MKEGDKVEIGGAEFEVISTYSRAQAIDDGFLVDVSETPEAKEAGFKIPIAMTRTVWDQYVEVPEGVTHQDLKGRLWDVLYMLRWAIGHRLEGTNPRELLYKLHVQNDNRDRTPPLVTLKAVVSGGDDGEPVMTIMLPEED